MISALTLLKQAEDYEGLIESAIESKDWDKLNEVLTSRQVALEELCILPLLKNERDALIKTMVLMQITDKRFIELVNTQKNIVQNQASSLTHDRKAVKAYQIE